MGPVWGERCMKKLRSALLWQMLGKQRKWVVWALILFIISALAILSVTQVTVKMVDDGIVAHSKPLGPYIGQILALAVISLIVGIANQLVTVRLSYQVEYDVR